MGVRKTQGAEKGRRIDDPRYRRILKILDLARLGRGWTRGEVEEALGRGKGYLKRVSDGPGELRVTDLLRAVDVLGLTPAEVFGPLVLGEEPEGGRLAAPSRRPAPTPSAGPLQQVPAAEGMEALVQRLVDERLAKILFEALDSATEAEPTPPSPNS